MLRTLFMITVATTWLAAGPATADVYKFKDDKGNVTTWGFEAEGPSTLTRAGIRKSDFTAGTEITITGHPMRDGRGAAAGTRATRGDGKQFDPRAGFAIR